jgi:hypothetical protein
MVVIPGDPSLIGSFTQVRLSSLRGNTFRAVTKAAAAGGASLARREVV